MSSRQSWPISQDANKMKGICSVCRSQRQLHNKDGTVHVHGPLKQRCPGSHQLPLSVISHVKAPSPGAGASVGVCEVEIRSVIELPTDSQSLHINQPLPQVSQITQLPQLRSTFTHPCLPSSTIKHIPKAARPSCAAALNNMLRAIVNNPADLDAWSHLLQFGSQILQAPPRQGKKHNLSKIIKERIAGLEKDEAAEPVTMFRRTKPSNRSSALGAAVRSKMEDGNISAAVRILCSEEGLAAPNNETLNKLKLLHPSPPPDRLPPPVPVGTAALQITEQDVLRAVRSFPAGSAGGPDGIRPQHLVELVTNIGSPSVLLMTLTAFINLLFNGDCPIEVRPILFGGRLIALDKKSGGVRPIAIGYTWRRLAAKCANTFAISRLTPYLQPLQLGAGVPGGCEAAVHAVRRFTADMPSDHALVKLDFQNAFNSLSRTRMLEAVFSKIPELYKYCHSSYASPSLLQFDKWSIDSQEGVQQGDPLGPVLFCITIHPLLNSLRSSLRAGYLDDITLGGKFTVLSRDVRVIMEAGTDLGLRLNISKCELFKHNDVDPHDHLLDSFTQLDISQGILLGAPITQGRAMDCSLSARVADLERAAIRLRDLSRHDSLTILRFSLSAPKVMHTLRCSPCFGHTLLVKFDDVLRETLCYIVNADLTDGQWSQASLPVRNGGLGIRQSSQLASSAFMASAVGTRLLQDSILTQCECLTAADKAMDGTMAAWSRGHDTPPPLGASAAKQASWDDPIILLQHQHLFQSCGDELDKARLLAVSNQRSGDWLHALPIANCGLLLDDEAVRVAVGFRLGAKICEPHCCPCGSPVDARGTHALSCKRASGRFIRHQNMNDIIWRALTRAGVPSTKEPVGLSRSDGKRPDGLTLIPWSVGKCAVWDVTVVDTVASSYLHQSSSSAGLVAATAASRKLVKYRDLEDSYEVIPIAFETFGPICIEGYEFLQNVGKRISQVSGDQRETSFLLQRLSVSLQRYNAICFRDTFATYTGSSEGLHSWEEDSHSNSYDSIVSSQQSSVISSCWSPPVFVNAESHKEKTGGLAFEVILQPAVTPNPPSIILREKSPTKDLSLSAEEIEKKLKDAEERRLSVEAGKLSLVNKSKDRAAEVFQRAQDLNESFSRVTEKTLSVKMEAFVGNKNLQIKALQDRLREHASRVEEVRKLGEMYKEQLKERIKHKLETAEGNSEARLKTIQDHIQKHEKHIQEVMEQSSKFSRDTEEKLIQKMESSVKNREKQLNVLLSRLHVHERHVEKVRLNQMNLSMNDESSSDARRLSDVSDNDNDDDLMDEGFDNEEDSNKITEDVLNTVNSKDLGNGVSSKVESQSSESIDQRNGDTFTKEDDQKCESDSTEVQVNEEESQVCIDTKMDKQENGEKPVAHSNGEKSKPDRLEETGVGDSENVSTAACHHVSSAEMQCCPPLISGLKIVSSDAPVPLKSVDINAGIKGFVANVTAFLVYKNPEENPIEVIYKFPMDDSSAVYRFEAEVDGRTIIAECQEKKQAKETYDAAVEAGHVAAFMEESDSISDIFSMRVGNIPAGGEVKITFGYVTELKLLSDGGIAQFTSYTLLNPRYNPDQASGGLQNPPTVPYVEGKQPYDFTFKAKVSNTTSISNITSTKEQLNIEYNTQKTEAVVSLSKPFVAVHDLSLDITYTDPFKPHVIIEKGITTEEGILMEDVLMMNFFPELKDSDYTSKHEFVIIIDRSGSMQGSRIDSAKETLLLFLKCLPMGCYFNIFGFGSHFDKLFPDGSKENSEENMIAAMEYQKNLDANFGGTEILQPLTEVYSKPATQTHSRQLFILTDGEVYNTNEIISIVRKNSNNTRVFSFGIGEGASTALVKGVARAGRGRAEFIKEGQRMQPIVMKTLKAAMQNGITDLKLEWKLGGSPKLVQIPKELPPMFSGDRLIVFAVSTGQAVLDGKVHMKGKVGERELDFVLDVNAEHVKSSVDGSLAVHRLAAKSQIQQLQDEEKENSEESKAAIILLSTASNIVSIHTAMVAVDKEKSAKVTGQRTVHEIPNVIDPSLQYCIASTRSTYSSGSSGRSRRSWCSGGRSRQARCDKGFMATNCNSSVKCYTGPRLTGGGGGPVAGAPAGFASNVCMDSAAISPESMETEEEKKELTGYMAVVQLQGFAGCWKLDSDLEKVIGKKLDELRKTKPDKISDEVWGTVLALAELLVKYSENRDEWEMIGMKAHQWIGTQKLFDHTLQSLLDIAKPLISAAN